MQNQPKTVKTALFGFYENVILETWHSYHISKQM